MRLFYFLAVVLFCKSLTEKEFLFEYQKLENLTSIINGQDKFRDRYVVVKSPDDKILLVTFIDESIKEIPDEETMHEFGYVGLDTLYILRDDMASRFVKREPVMSLKYLEFPRMSPDDMMRNKVQRIIAVQPPTFVTEYIYLKGVINPAIISLSNRTFISWKTGWGSDVSCEISV